MFARQHPAVTAVFDTKHHMLWSTLDGYETWDPVNNDNQCIGGAGGGAGVARCCQSTDGTSPFLTYNDERNQCCPDGSVKNFSQNCF